MKKYFHKKTGKPYSIVSDHVMFKHNGEWIKDLVLYKTEYHNPEGEYFVRTKEDFNEHFVEMHDMSTELDAIYYNGENLLDVLQFTGMDSRFYKWFKDFNDYQEYVKAHDNIFKIFTGQGMSHYCIYPYTLIVKTPEGEALPFVGNFIKINDNN